MAAPASSRWSATPAPRRESLHGLERPGEGQTLMPDLTRRYARALAAHREDHVLGQHPSHDF